MSHVKILSITHNLDIPYSERSNKQGSYKGTELIYRNLDNGNTVTKTFANSMLVNSKSFAAKLGKLAAGDEVYFKNEKKGNFTNIVDISKEPFADSGSSTSNTNRFSKGGGNQETEASITASVAVKLAVEALGTKFTLDHCKALVPGLVDLLLDTKTTTLQKLQGTAATAPKTETTSEPLLFVSDTDASEAAAEEDSPW